MRRIFTVPDGIHSDAHPDYEAGRIAQLDADEREARILAFGAIRRAAEVAREYDRKAKESEYHAYLLWREYQESGKADRDYARLSYERADAIRTAIRAAIGSEKS